jgi:hypothetical protein
MLSWLILFPAALEHATVLFESPKREVLCERDAIQDYAMVRALYRGADPYREIADVVASEVPECSGLQPIPFFHPSPHPIAMAVFTHPLAPWVSFLDSFRLRVLIELLLFISALFLSARFAGTTLSLPMFVTLILVGVASFRGFDTLFHGQINFTLFFLFTLAALALSEKREILAAFSLGIAAALKLAGWPFFVLFLLRGRFKLLALSAGTFALVQVLSIGVLGFESWYSYFTQVIPAVNAYYIDCGNNESLFSMARHLFVGYSKPCFAVVDDGSIAPALISSPGLFSALSLGLPALVLTLLLYASWKRERLEEGFLVLACAGPALSGLMWGHAAAQNFILLPLLLRYRDSLSRSSWLRATLVLTVALLLIFPTFDSKTFPFVPLSLWNQLALLSTVSSTLLALALTRTSTRNS